MVSPEVFGRGESAQVSPLLGSGRVGILARHPCGTTVKMLRTTEVARHPKGGAGSESAPAESVGIEDCFHRQHDFEATAPTGHDGFASVNVDAPAPAVPNLEVVLPRSPADLDILPSAESLHQDTRWWASARNLV